MINDSVQLSISKIGQFVAAEIFNKTNIFRSKLTKKKKKEKKKEKKKKKKGGGGEGQAND